MSTLQPREHLRGMALRVQRLMVNDLKAIPEDKQSECPGGCARTPLSLVVECAYLNGMIADYLQTGEMNRMPPDQREAHFASFDTQEKALAYLEQETQRYIAVVETLDESTLGEVSDQPLGRPMSRFAVAELPSIHMMYHDGQLNYIQTLYGDSEMHWG